MVLVLGHDKVSRGYGYGVRRVNSSGRESSARNICRGGSDIFCSNDREKSDIWYNRLDIYKENIFFRVKDGEISLEIICLFLCNRRAFIFL
jgi:hypothetical protein